MLNYQHKDIDELSQFYLKWATFKKKFFFSLFGRSYYHSRTQSARNQTVESPL